jgi:hypothetical protein
VLFHLKFDLLSHVIGLCDGGKNAGEYTSLHARATRGIVDQGVQLGS